MRYIVYGAGGVGGTIAARLFLSDVKVVVVARGEHAKSLQAQGLHFVSPQHDEWIPVQTVQNVEDLSWKPDDLVLLCVKSQHTEAALDSLYRATHSSQRVVCCQNGVENERIALRRFSHVYAMCVRLPAEHLEPGLVVSYAHDPAGSLNVGRYPHGIDDTSSELASVLQKAGFQSQPDPTVMRLKYTKLLMNLTNGVQALTGASDQDIGDVLRREAYACFAAAGIDSASLDSLASIVKFNRGVTVPNYQRHGSSTLQSLLRGTGNTEADFLNGEIVLLGRLYDVPTPANALIQQQLSYAVQSTQKPSISLADLKAAIIK